MTKINHDRWQLKLSDNRARELAKAIESHLRSPDPTWPIPLHPISESEAAKTATANFFEKFGAALDNWNDSERRDALSVASEVLLAAKAFDPYDNRMTVGVWLTKASPEDHPLIEILQKAVEFSRSGTWKP
jgi:hypothetical protein